MGGLLGNGAANLSTMYTNPISCSIGGYFQERFSNPFSVPAINPNQYISKPETFNQAIPSNIDLVAGDRIIYNTP
jgi:hypothetical protein